MPRKVKADPQRQGKKRSLRGAGKSEPEEDDRDKSESVDALAMATVVVMLENGSMFLDSTAYRLPHKFNSKSR